MGDNGRKPTVLVVDDEPDLVDLYATNLADDYDVRTAYGGEEALELIDSVDGFDVALIDRRMPDVSGDEVLDRLHETTPDCRVAMVTAVEPDFDVIEMPFDRYLVKPVTRDALLETVARLVRLASYREKRQEAFALASKVATLRTHKDTRELEGNDDYDELVERLDEIRDELDDAIDSFDTGDFAAAFADIDAGNATATTTE